MWKKLKERCQHILKKETGSASMYMIIFMVFFLPFALWIGVKLPMKIESTYTIKQMVDNAADSAVSRLDEESLTQGEVAIDPTEANEVVNALIRKTLNLDENGNPSGKGILKEQIPFYSPLTIQNIQSLPKDSKTGEYILPEDVGVYVYIVNNPTTSISVKGILPITKTSVIVRANIPIENGGWLGNRVVVHKTGVSEAELNINYTEDSEK